MKTTTKSIKDLKINNLVLFYGATMLITSNAKLSDHRDNTWIVPCKRIDTDYNLHSDILNEYDYFQGTELRLLTVIS